MGRDGHLHSLGDSWGGSIWCQFNPPITGVEALGSAPSDSWGSSLDIVAVGVSWCLLVRGGTEDMEECYIAPLKSPTDPLHLIPPLLIQSFAAPPSPTTVLHPIGSLLFQQIQPLKRIKGGLSPRSSLGSWTVNEWLERLSNARQKEYLMQQPPCFFLCQYHKPCTSIQEWAKSNSCSSFVTTLISSSSDDSSVSETNPDIQGNILVRSRKKRERIHTLIKECDWRYNLI